MSKLLCTLLIFITLSAKAQETYSISGTVIDERGMTVPGAVVFITNSKYIQATNNEGKFNFNNIRPGTYEIVARMLGLEPGTQSIKVSNNVVNLEINLKPSNKLLNTVTINEKPDPDREKYLAWFIQHFIGETVNSQQCKLLNPGVIHFHFNKSTRVLTTTADDFLVVENKALGYKIKYLLSGFEIDLNNQSGYYDGYPYFEEMEGDAVQQKKWQDNRKLAYLSSARHFFRAIMNNTAEQEGFIVYEVTNDLDIINKSKNVDRTQTIAIVPDPDAATDETEQSKTKENTHKTIQSQQKSFTLPPGSRAIVKVLHADSLFSAEDANFKSLTSAIKISGKDTIKRISLFIVYTGATEPLLFSKTGHPITSLMLQHLPAKRQITKMQWLTDKITIDHNGIPAPEMGYKYGGYWAWQRIADLTPLDYFVEPEAPVIKK